MNRRGTPKGLGELLGKLDKFRGPNLVLGAVVHHDIVEIFTSLAVFDAADVIADKNKSFCAVHLRRGVVGSSPDELTIT